MKYFYIYITYLFITKCLTLHVTFQAHKLGILPPTTTTASPIGSTNAPPTSGTIKRELHGDIIKKKVDNKTRQLLVINVEDKDALVKYFVVINYCCYGNINI